MALSQDVLAKETTANALKHRVGARLMSDGVCDSLIWIGLVSLNRAEVRALTHSELIRERNGLVRQLLSCLPRR